MVGSAVQGVDRDPHDGRPREAVRRRGHDDVVRRAAGAEAAVMPHDIHLPGAVDLGRGQRRVAKTARNSVGRLRRHGRRARPAVAAVLRAKDTDTGEVCRVRDDHGPVRLYDGHASQSSRKPTGCEGRAPRETAVRGRAHHQLVALAVVGPLRVAVPVEGARRPGVAGDPVLVVEAARAKRNRDRALPCETAVRRSAREDGARGSEKRRGRPEGERRDHPDVVLRVVGHRRVADPRPRPALVERRLREIARRPGSARVGRGRPGDVAGTAVEGAAGLEGRDNRVSV